MRSSATKYTTIKRIFGEVKWELYGVHGGLRSAESVLELETVRTVCFVIDAVLEYKRSRGSDPLTRVSRLQAHGAQRGARPVRRKRMN